jgi:hypothetical protein
MNIGYIPRTHRNVFTPVLIIFLHKDNETYLFHNYVNESHTFTDASSTTILTAAVFRFATLCGIYTHIPQALQSLEAIFGSHIINGTLYPVRLFLAFA